jgi:hypothetical protein
MPFGDRLGQPSRCGLGDTSALESEDHGYTLVEARVSIPADGQAGTTALCPTGDVVVGGGGYEVTQGLDADLNTSLPFGSAGLGWIDYFNNLASTPNTGVVVAICVSAASVSNYSVHLSKRAVTIPAGGSAPATAGCPKGTVALGGGGENQGQETSQSIEISAPFNHKSWSVWMGSAGSESTDGYAGVVCSTKPAGWFYASTELVADDPPGQATNYGTLCPSGLNVLGGGSSLADQPTSPDVTIGLTTPYSALNGWHTVENNASSTDESSAAWAICAKVEAAA